MKTLLIILLPLFSFSQGIVLEISVKGQLTYRYSIDKSRDGVRWNTDTSFSLPHNDGIYEIPLSKINPLLQYRLHILGTNDYFYSKHLIDLPVEITNTVIKNGVLTWTSHNEDLKYYSIEESKDGINFVETGRVIPKGDGDYKFILK